MIEPLLSVIEAGQQLKALLHQYDTEINMLLEEQSIVTRVMLRRLRDKIQIAEERLLRAIKENK